MSVKWLCLFSLDGSFEELSDQCNQPFHISFCHALHLSFPDHVHDLESLEGSPGSLKGKEAHPLPCQSLDEAVILLDASVDESLRSTDVILFQI